MASRQYSPYQTLILKLLYSWTFSRRNCSKMFCKTAPLKNLGTFTFKHLGWNLFWAKLQSLGGDVLQIVYSIYNTEQHRYCLLAFLSLVETLLLNFQWLLQLIKWLTEWYIIPFKQMFTSLQVCKFTKTRCSFVPLNVLNYYFK